MTTSLAERHTDATYRLIIDASIELLKRTNPTELTMRAVAKHAGMSERTIFRYYSSREEFLDAVALAVYRSFETPAPPATLQELPAYPRDLYTRFEQHAALVKATLHNEIALRIRVGVGQERWRAVRKLIDVAAPYRSDRDRRIVSANIDYYLTATAWHYYRFFFGLPLEETIEAAQTAIRLASRDILARPAAARARKRER
jgi:AcrR family transcriptional regulator